WEVGVIVWATVRAPTLPRKTPMADATPAASPAPTPAAAPLQERLVTTEHKHKLGKRILEYSVTCGTLMLREDEGNKDGQRSADKPRAALFFIAYTLKRGDADAPRPITFSFNGGPGSSSVWLHLGILGPQRVATDEMGNSPAPPYSLIDNEYSLLEVSDLVFIDPVGTGY